MATLVGDRGTQHTTPLTQHEIDFLLSNFLGCYNEIAFIFAILVIDNDDKFAAFQLFDGFINGIQFEFVHFLLRI